MKNFIKNIFSSMIGGFFAIILTFFVFFIAFIGIATISLTNEESNYTVPKNSVLKIKLNKIIVDKNLEKPFDEINFFSNKDTYDLFKSNYMGLDDILNVIEDAKSNKNIKGISLNVQNVSAGWTQLKDIRNKLNEFKSTGKFITSYGHFYTQKAYYLSSVANEIYLNPSGYLDFKGLHASIMFYKKLQDNIGIKMDVIRYGKYKSAVEPYLNDKMSSANRAQNQRLIDVIWKNTLNDISKSKGISEKKLNQIADNLDAKFPIEAIKNKLITNIITSVQYENLLKNKVGIEEGDKLKTTSILKYKQTLTETYADDKIVVLYAQGVIDYKYSKGHKSIGFNLIDDIRKVKKDKDVKAVVLRINSPGGSALVSDLIWQELELLKEKKPLIVSFGDVAASGGYYIACGADKIVASQNTITGSIGVFSVILNAKKLANTIGITTDEVTTNKYSAKPSEFRGLKKNERQEVKKEVVHIYETFVNKVAKCRNLSFEEVDAIAQGRVWIGTDALKIGLIDSITNLEGAIKIAAKMAKITEWETVSYPKKKDPIKVFFENFSKNISTNILNRNVPNEYLEMYNQLKMNTNLKGIQAMLPVVYNIK